MPLRYCLPVFMVAVDLAYLLMWIRGDERGRGAPAEAGEVLWMKVPMAKA